MHPILQQLNNDHRHMAKVLHCLNNHLSATDSADQAAPKLWLLIAALDYIQVYPERWHHPVEDLIFERLANNYPECTHHVEVIQEEHEHLESMTNAMLELCNAFLDDNNQAIKSMRLILLFYLNLQKKHMRREDKHLYPYINKHLTTQDWKAIERTMPKINDPLFGDAVKHNYERMYEEIITAERSA